MKHGLHSAFRTILLSAFALLLAGQAKAQVSPIPPCTGSMSLYFSVLYRDCASARANVQVTPSCGTAPFSYQWSNGTISPDLIDVPPGTYTATVTEATGLKAVGSVTVLPPATTPFNMTATVVGLGCTGSTGTGSANISFTGGTAPYDLRWRKTGTTNFLTKQNVGSPYTITGLTAGNWIIISNDERGCRDTAFVDIKQGLVVTSSTGGATCSGANVTINATGGTAPYKIDWTGGTSVNGVNLPRTFNNVASGTYTFTVTDNTGCSGTTQVAVTGTSNFTIGANTTAVTCTNSTAGSITVNLTSAGVAPYTIQLNGGAAQPATFPFTYSNLAAGEYNIRVTDAANCTANTTVKVETALDVVLQVKAPAAPLCGGSDVVVSLGNTGTAPYTVSWTGANGFSGNATTSTFPYTIANVPPGPITVNVKDNTGCTGSETGTATGNPVMQIRAVNIVSPTCANPQGGAFTVEFVTPGTAPYTLTWSGGTVPEAFSGSKTFSNLSGSTYTVTVTDANNCPATLSVTIDPALMVVLTPKPAANADCGGQDVEVSLSGNPGVSPYTITWAGGTGLQNGTVTNQTMPFTIANAAPGNFCVTITDATGCTGTKCISVEGNSVLLIRAINVTHPTCDSLQAGSFTIEIASPGTPGYSIAYNGPSSPTINGLTYSNLGPGIYEVVVNDSKGCTDSMVVKIETPLDVVLTPQPAANATCGGQDVVVSIAGNPGVSPYTISWSGGNGAQTGEVKNQTLPFTIANAAPGEFCVTITDAEGCSGTECIEVKGNPVMLIKAKDIVHATCAAPNGGAFTVEFVVPGVSPYTIAVEGPTGPVFSGPFTSPRTFSALASGTYTVIVTDANNCTATTTVKINPPLNVVLTPQPAANATCGGQDVVVSIAGNPGTSPYTITWSGGNGAQTGEVNNQTIPFTIANAAPGTFCVTVTDATGCSGSTCINVVGAPVMLIGATSTAVTCADSTAGTITVNMLVNGMAPYTIQWTGGGPAVSATFPYTINNLTAGNYTITVTDAKNCTATTTVKVETALNVVLTPQPAANATCGGQDVVVSIAGNPGVSPYTISWSGGNGAQTGEVKNQTLPFTIANAAPGEFCVTVTDAEGCSGTECIEVKGNPVMLIKAKDIVHATCAAPNGGAFTVEFVVPGVSPYTIAVEGPTGPVFSGPFTSPRTFSALAPGIYTVLVTDANNCTATTTVKIETPLDVVLNPIPPANALCGGADVVVTIKGAQQGTPGYTINWSNADTTFAGTVTVSSLPYTIPNVPPGTICVTVTDSQGCTGTECTSVIGDPVMLIQATATGVTCADSTAGTITVTMLVPGKAPYDIAWSGPAGGNQTGVTFPHTLTSLPSGEYCITVTDANGCTATDCVRVETALNVVLNAIPPAASLCGGQDVVIDITGTQGTPPYSITWSGANGFAGSATGATLPFTVPNVPPGIFNVTVTDANGCTGSERTTITGDPVMVIQVDTVIAVTCENQQGGSITVSFAVPGKAPYTIAWTGSGAAIPVTLPFTINDLSAGDYCITVTDANNCTATVCARVETALDVVLNPIPPANALCGGADVVVTLNGTQQGTPDYTINWSNADGTFEGEATVSSLPYTIPNVPPGTICVTVTDSHGCTGTECTSVTGDPVMLIKATATGVTCADSTAGTITVTILVPGTAPYGIAWSGPISGNQLNVPLPHTITGLLQGNYCITVTDANGCTATDCVRVESAIDVTLTPAVASDPQCGGANLIVDVASGGTPPYQYTWSGPFGQGGTVNPANFPDTLENLPLGEYSFTVTDSEGCTGVESIILTGQPKMIIEVDSVVAISCFGGGSDGMIVVNMPVPGVAPYTIQWTGGTPVQNATFPFKINGLEPGDYIITVTDSRGCTATATAKIETALDVTLQVVPGTNFQCAGSNLIVNVVNGGTPPFDISWSGPSTGQVLDVLLPDTLKGLTPGTYIVTVTDATGCTGTETATISGDTMFQIAALGTNLTCSGDGKDGKAVISLVQGGKSPISLSWAGGTPVQNVSFPYSITSLEGGAMTFMATDANGCSSSATVNLTGGPAEVELEPLSALDTCVNLPILLNVKNLDLSDTLKYTWATSNPAIQVNPTNTANPTITATAPGNYTVTVVATNQYGCSKTLTQEVSFDPLESLQGLISANICNGLLVQFDNLSTMEGTWSFGDSQTSTLNDPSHLYKTPGQYVVSFEANQECVLKFDTMITVQATPAVEADFGFKVNDCFGQAVIQFTDSTVFAATGKSWSWTFNPPAQSSSTQNPLVTFTQNGTITANLIATDQNGCADTFALEVPIQFVTDTIQEEFVFCVGDSIQLNPDGVQTTFAYAWTSSPSDPTLTPLTNPSPVVKPVQNTTYQLTIKTPNGFCKVEYSAKATIKPTVSGTDPADLNACDDDPLTLSLGASNGTSFVWSDSPAFSPVLSQDSTLTIVPEKGKTYYYKAVHPTLCPLQGEVKVNLGELNLNPGPLDQKVCDGNEAVLNIENLDADDNLTFVWTPALDPVANPSVVPTENGTYSVIVTNQFGCVDTLEFEVEVIKLNVTAEIIGKDTICVGETAKLLATISGNVQNPVVTWTPAQSLTGANTLDPTAKPDVPTYYTVQVTSSEGLCPDTAGVNLFVVTGQCIEPFIFVPKAFTPNGDNNNDFFVVRGVNITEMTFIVWDRWGEEVYRTTDPAAPGWDGTFNGRELTPDSYAWYLEARCGNGARYVKKGDVTLLK